MASTSPDHFALIRDFIKPTTKIFSSFRSSGTHPPNAEILRAINAIHAPLSKHVARFPDDIQVNEEFRAFATSLSVAAYELGSRLPAWNAWLVRKSPADFNPDNHFLRSMRLLANYEYPGVPVEDSEEEAEGSEESDSTPEVPPPASLKTGPPKKRQRVDPPAPVTHLPVDPSPAPSISTRSRSQLKTAPRAQATLPFKASTAPAAASSSSRTRTTSTHATSPVTRAAPVASKSRKASSVIEPQDSDGEQVDELDDEPEPTPKPSKGKGKAKKPTLLPREVMAQRILAAPGPSHPEAISASQVDFRMHEQLQNPGRCLACTTLSFKGEPHECKFLGWGRRCGSCQSSGKARCTFELHPQELDQVLESVSPLVSSSREQLRVLVLQINRLLQDATLFAQLADRANRNAAYFILQLIEHARYLRKEFPPGHVVGPRFEDMDILDTLLSGDHSLLDDYLDKSATQKGFPPMASLNGYFASLPEDDSSTALAFIAADTAFRSYHATDPLVASTSQQAPSRSAASSEDAATQPSAADLFNEDVLSDTRDPQELSDSREADELDELDDAPMQTDN
ncbi:hypothetical protein BDZ97DRAFT_1930234 [Flammula alnicola]|nr:hypothetical protein BDZ97DRAFT_1930234 [Flammula alnicola]